MMCDKHDWIVPPINPCPACAIEGRIEKLEKDTARLEKDRARLLETLIHLKNDVSEAILHMITTDTRMQNVNLRRHKELADAVRKIKKMADGGVELVSNQGQALDGYSELAEYRGAIEADRRKYG